MSLNITDAIFFRGERDPHTIAVIDPERIIDYRTLCRSVCLAAQQFRQAGWKTDDIVGISLRDNPTLHIVSSLALARMGITQASVPASDPVSLRLSRMQRLGITGLVMDYGWGTNDISVTTVTPEPDWLTTRPDSVVVDDLRAPGGDRIWYINETSGTSAAPKLIGVSHATEDVHRRTKGTMFPHLSGERFLQLSGMRFLTALKRAIACFSDGGTLTLAPPGLPTDQLLQWIDRHHVTYIHCVPLHLHQLLRDIRTDTPRLPSLRILRSSSSSLSVSAVQEIRKRISPNLYISYGTSETGPITAATPAMLALHPDTVGVPLEGVELEIVDDDDQPLTDGMPGHVRVRGPGIGASYFHAAQAADRPRTFRNGWCYPGDIAVRNSNGLVFHKGRSDEVMNFDGIMVGPNEIESVLRQHPAVMEVAAFALPSLEHQDIPAAAIVSGQPLQTDELGRFCAERLGIRAPRLFIRVDEIPKNPMGKVLRRRLTEVAMQKLQEQSRS